MAGFYQCLRADSSENIIMATGLTDSKIHEAESPRDEGKKKSKFKSFKKLFVKKKKKEFVVNAGKSSMKQSQSTSDVTSPKSCTPDLKSDQCAYKSILGIRALSHDSIFISDTSVQQPPKPVRVFSQESVSGPIKDLQGKVQENIKLGPPPMSIAAKKTEDTGASSEDDGLPRSPPESSPLQEALTRSHLAKLSDSHQNHSSLTLGETGSEEEEQISPGSSSRPNSPLPTIIPTRSSSRPRSPTSTPVQTSADSFASSAIDFNSPPTSSICLNNSAAKHKLSVKPRNQRSSSKRRRPSSRLLFERSSELMYDVPEVTEEYEQEIRSCDPENANSEVSLKDGTEIPPSPVLTLGQSLLFVEQIIVWSSGMEVVSKPEQQTGELIPVDIAASPNVLDVDDDLKANSMPAVLSETGEDVDLIEFEIVEVAATQISMLPGSTTVLPEDPTPLEFIDRLKQKGVNIPGSEVESKVCDTHNVSIDTSFAKETAYQTSPVILLDRLSPDSEKPPSPREAEINEVAFVQESPETSCEQTKTAGASEEPSFSEACSIKQAAKEASGLEGRSSEVPEEFSSIVSTRIEVYSQPAETPKDLLVSETANGKPENREMAVFKEANINLSDDKTTNQQSSFKKNGQGSFKFSISSAWNRSKRGTKWSEGNLTADSDISRNKSHQKEKTEKDGETPLSEPSVAKTEADKPEKAEEGQGGVEDGRGLFGVKLRTTSHSLKYKESSHSESKEAVKRHGADATLDSDNSDLPLKAERREAKEPPEGSLSNTLKDDDGILQAKSSECLAVKPPLPKKPVLQNVNIATTATEKPNKPLKPSQERLKDAEKKSSVSKSSERGLLFDKHTQDNGSSTEDSSIPAWVTMARQKQKGYHVQHYGKADTMPAQEAKTVGDRKAVDKEILKSPTKLKNNHHKSSPPCKPQDSKQELKSTEPQQKVSPIPSPVTANRHSLATPQSASDKDGKDQHSKEKTSPSSSQPSWMELAKKKAKAWSDMPQIIK
ncbi:CRACD-like protein isoform X2 [Scyliorhinus canicula]|uniref:CRACD-like protein isoform X2 n=1 Tax=Scyliorhinus canicula TaxID=7830 RepID=UPI0018F61C99|nr:CRACD-like protein isoform X2 [Scyliorhinus canicula]